MTARFAVAAAIAAVLAPWSTAKLLLLALALGLGFSAAAEGLTLLEHTVRRAAVTAWWAFFVISPYWMLPPTRPLRLAALAVTALAGLAWSRLADRSVHSPSRPTPAAALAVVALAQLALTWRGLKAPLEYRGDEDFHAAWPLAVLESLQAVVRPFPVVGALLLTPLVLALGLSPRSRRVAFLAWTAVLPLYLAAGFWIAAAPETLLNKVVRYPTGSAWLHTLAAFSPWHSLTAPMPRFYDEALLRMAPALSWLALGCWVVRIAPGTWPAKACAAQLLLAAPTAHSHAVALYPEATSAVLVTVGLWGSDRAARRRLTGRPDASPAALLLAAGIALKESFHLTGLATVGYYVVWSLVRRRARSQGSWRARLKLGLLLLGPALLYLAWRFSAPSLLGPALVTRALDLPALGPLLNPELYRIGAVALWQQFGALLIPAAAALVKPRNPVRVGLWVSVFLAQWAFFATDLVEATPLGELPGYWGYSRYFLTLFPPLACLALSGTRAILRKGHGPFVVAMGALVAVQLSLSPIRLDGSRAPFWGDYVRETSGERYPYDELYEWLARAGERRGLTIVGRDYSYRDDFYSNKRGLELRIEAPRAPVPRSSLVVAGGPDRQALLGAHVQWLEGAARAPGPIVLHVSAWLDADDLPRDVGPLRAVRSFRLGRHALILYDRRSLS